MSKLLLVIMSLAAVLVATPSQSQTPAERQRCNAMRYEWQQRVDQYNRDCANVPAGSERAQACAARRSQILASKPNC